MKSFLTAVTLAPLLAFGVAGAQSPMTEFEVRALLDSEGFPNVDDIDFELDSGLWEAEVVTADGDEIEVHVDPLTGRILFGDGSPYVSTLVPPRTVVVPAPRTVVVPAERTVERTVVIPAERTVVERTVVLPAERTVAVPVYRAPVNEAEVRDVLVDAGFHDIHDVEYDGGRWRAEVRDATGEDFEVELDPVDGRIVHLEDD